MGKLRVALKEPGLTSFDYKTWGEYQPFNPDTLLQDFTEVCAKRDVDICVVTSEYWELPKGSLHNRFDFLQRQMDGLPKGFYPQKLGDNVILVKKFGKPPMKDVYFINGQSVIVAEPKKNPENGKHRRLGHLVIGSNQVPNLMNLKDTIQYCNDNGLIQIAEDSLSTIDPYLGGSGLDESELVKHLENYDAFQGHNAHFTVPEFIAQTLPRISKKFSRLLKISRGLNRKAQEFAEICEKPYVAITGSHRIQDIGTAHIEISDALINKNDEEGLIGTLKSHIGAGSFENVRDYIPILGVLKWANQFSAGCANIDDPLDKKYEPMFE